MNIFKKFKVTFNLKNPSKKDKNKGESDIRCLKYRICSEFTTEHVFDTNPSHLQDKPFTPTQSRKLQTKSQSENNIALQTLSFETVKPDKEAFKNSLWPSDSEIQNNAKLKEIDTSITINPDITNTSEQKLDENQVVVKPKKEKGILKNKNEKVEIVKRNPEEKQLYDEDHYARTNFNEEVTYEQYEPIDDQLGVEDIYYFEQKPNENPSQYVVHNNRTVHFTESDHEYEVPIPKQDQRIIANPVYNLTTHPKLNPTIQGIDDEHARSIGLNSFGNAQKLKYPGDYSMEAASIFFDNQNDYEC
ncbi:uncharacterized protein LOC123671162 [Harmonia axyridis]|uniref:uncharacterized protein LOC123671162 n=1 Tax=Harmonia axyridis TaxID=115357 RepID=UPI001E275E7F|nr:uncharacterized protein LOC123671162 [Harmonia axyridis]